MQLKVRGKKQELGNEIYEIKPITQHALPEGKQQLQKYVDKADIPGARKGQTLLPELNGKSVGDITYSFSGVCTYTKSYHLVTFKDPSQAGMIYYAEDRKLNFSPLKQTVQDATKALGKGFLMVGIGVVGVIGALVYN